MQWIWKLNGARFINLPTVAWLGSLEFRSVNPGGYVTKCDFRAALRGLAVYAGTTPGSSSTSCALRMLHDYTGRYTVSAQ